MFVCFNCKPFLRQISDLPAALTVRGSGGRVSGGGWRRAVTSGQWERGSAGRRQSRAGSQPGIVEVSSVLSRYLCIDISTYLPLSICDVSGVEVSENVV